jgi:hypothetical protein
MQTSKPNTPEPEASPTWDRLEDFVREHVQRFTKPYSKKRSRSCWDERSQPDERLSMLAPKAVERLADDWKAS